MVLNDTVEPGERWLCLWQRRRTLEDLRRHIWSVCGRGMFQGVGQCGEIVEVGVETELTGAFLNEKGSELGWERARNKGLFALWAGKWWRADAIETLRRCMDFEYKGQNALMSYCTSPK